MMITMTATRALPKTRKFSPRRAVYLYPKGFFEDQHGSLDDLNYARGRKVEHAAWLGARSRCHNPSDPKFMSYGWRGIQMAPEWFANFDAFYEHVGPRPHESMSLDRIDNDRGYEPGNVRWATRWTQNHNTRRNRRTS